MIHWWDFKLSFQKTSLSLLWILLTVEAVSNFTLASIYNDLFFFPVFSDSSYHSLESYRIWSSRIDSGVYNSSWPGRGPQGTIFLHLPFLYIRRSFVGNPHYGLHCFFFLLNLLVCSFILPISPVQTCISHVSGSKTVAVYWEANGLGPPFRFIQYPFYLGRDRDYNRIAVARPFFFFLASRTTRIKYLHLQTNMASPTSVFPPEEARKW